MVLPYGHGSIRTHRCPLWPGSGLSASPGHKPPRSEASPCTRAGQRRQLRGPVDDCFQEANGLPLSVHFFFKMLVRFRGSTLGPLWLRVAWPVKGMVFKACAGGSRGGGALG